MRPHGLQGGGDSIFDLRLRALSNFKLAIPQLLPPAGLSTAQIIFILCRKLFAMSEEAEEEYSDDGDLPVVEPPEGGAITWPGLGFVPTNRGRKTFMSALLPSDRLDDFVLGMIRLHATSYHPSVRRETVRLGGWAGQRVLAAVLGTLLTFLSTCNLPAEGSLQRYPAQMCIRA